MSRALLFPGAILWECSGTLMYLFYWLSYVTPTPDSKANPILLKTILPECH